VEKDTFITCDWQNLITCDSAAATTAAANLRTICLNLELDT
jgi:hypothetical protein